MKDKCEKNGFKLNIQKMKIVAYVPITSWQTKWGNTLFVFHGETGTDIFLGSKITADSDCSHEIKKTLAPWRKSCDKPKQHIKKQRYHFDDKGMCSQSYAFSSSHV